MSTPPLASELLHLNCSLHAIRLQCAKLQCEALLCNAACDAIADEARRRSHSALLRLRVAVLRSKAGFNPDQPRVPAGNPDGGQWTSGGGGIGRSTISSGAQWAQRRLPATVDYSNAMTGISTIDDTTKKLGETLRQVVDTEGLLPGLDAQKYGTFIHGRFAAAVRRQNLLGIGYRDVETTFPLAFYGMKGSIRTDVVLRNEVGDIIAIYDLKTGEADLSPGRVRELRAKTGVGLSVPVIQLNVSRKSMLKSSDDWRLGYAGL